jgi:hypothetical protein
MRASILVFTAATALQVSIAGAQFSAVKLTGGATASLTGSPGCSECDWGKANELSVGILFRDFLGLGYQRIAWHALESSNQSISLDLANVELHARDGRVSPFFMLGIGRGSVALDQSWGGHYEDKYSASSSFAMSLGLGLDFRLYHRLTLTPLISAPKVTNVGQIRCATSYMGSGYPTTYCSPSPAKTRMGYTAFGIGLGWR